jgi:hypothetical protein
VAARSAAGARKRARYASPCAATKCPDSIDDDSNDATAGLLLAPARASHGGGMAPRRKRERTVRRARARTHEQLVRDLDRLARLAPGGAPERAIPIDSPAVVDVRAVAKPCPLCGGSLRLEAHAAEVVDGVRLRVATVACVQCGTQRAIWFRLASPTIH